MEDLELAGSACESAARITLQAFSNAAARRMTPQWKLHMLGESVYMRASLQSREALHVFTERERLSNHQKYSPSIKLQNAFLLFVRPGLGTVDTWEFLLPSLIWRILLT